MKSINNDTIHWLLTHSAIPVLGCIAESDNGGLGAINLDDGLHHLSAYAQPLKVLLLNAEGGIVDHTGKVRQYSMSENCLELIKIMNLYFPLILDSKLQCQVVKRPNIDPYY